MQVPIPDKAPAEMLQREGCLSMVAGDFVDVYRTPAQAQAFDAVATCFFIDTAHNIFEYIDVIWHTLKVCRCSESLAMWCAAAGALMCC